MRPPGSENKKPKRPDGADEKLSVACSIDSTKQYPALWNQRFLKLAQNFMKYSLSNQCPPNHPAGKIGEFQAASQTMPHPLDALVVESLLCELIAEFLT
jgi:hypothetical protein